MSGMWIPIKAHAWQRVDYRGRGVPYNTCANYHSPKRVIPLSLTRLHAGRADSSVYRKLVAKNSGVSFREVAMVQSDLSLDELMHGLGDGELVIKVRYAGVNGGCETFRCRGEYAFSRHSGEQGFALGAEGVGEIVACGGDSCNGFPVGSPVMFVGGAFSEYVRVKAVMCTPIESIRKEYVSIRISGNVAHASLKYVAGIQEGDVVLVTAAAGATGSFAVQYAKQMGCHVVATCRNRDKASILETYGVDRVIDYTTEDVESVLKYEGYAGMIDVAYEGVGGTLQALAWKNVRPEGGRLLSVGYISEYPHATGYSTSAPTKTADDLPPSDELFWGGKTIRDPRGKIAYGNVWPSDASLRHASLHEVCRMYQLGTMIPLVDPTSFQGLESIPDAIEYMLSGNALGKVIVSF